MKKKAINTLSKAYTKGGYWGAALGVSVATTIRKWPEDAIWWSLSSALFLVIYLWGLHIAHKME